MGIMRISPTAYFELEKYLENCLEDLVPLLKEEMAVNGRKTLIGKDIPKILESMNKRDKQLSWEV